MLYRTLEAGIQAIEKNIVDFPGSFTGFPSTQEEAEKIGYS